eukprot:s13_g29.t1
MSEASQTVLAVEWCFRYDFQDSRKSKLLFVHPASITSTGPEKPLRRNVLWSDSAVRVCINRIDKPECPLCSTALSFSWFLHADHPCAEHGFRTVSPRSYKPIFAGGPGKGNCGYPLQRPPPAALHGPEGLSARSYLHRLIPTGSGVGQEEDYTPDHHEQAQVRQLSAREEACEDDDSSSDDSGSEDEDVGAQAPQLRRGMGRSNSKAPAVYAYSAVGRMKLLCRNSRSSLRAPSLDHDWWAEFFTIGDITFAGFFAIDVMLRIILLRADFWRVWLNYIDFAVSLTSIAEVAFVYVNQNLPVSPILFRLLRIGKLVRAFRMVTMSSVLNSLQLLIKCLVASRDMLLWSFCLLTFVQCVAGLVLATLCRDFIEEESNDPEVRGEVFRYYGTFTRTILSMFEIMFANWGPPCRVLVENVSEWFSIFFLSYRCVLGFAVLNVVNAVFVQQTMKTASSDEELAFRQKEKDIALYNRKVKKLFKTIDSSGDGAINLEEFSKLVKSPKLQFWMSQLELEYHDLLSLFEFLDNGDGQITLGEFLEGAQRLRGGAKAIDVWRMETKVEVLFDAVLSMLKETCPASAAAILASKGLSPPEPIPPSDSHDNSEELGGTKTEDIITRTSTSNVHDVFKQSEFRHIKPTSFWQLDVNLP